MEHVLTTKSRNLGFGWSNQPIQQYNSRGDGYLVIDTPGRPDAVGGLRAVESEISRAIRINGTSYWRGRLYVDGQPVTARWGGYWEQLREDHGPDTSFDVIDEWRECWVRVQTLEQINEILQDVRDGRTVRVRTEEQS